MLVFAHDGAEALARLRGDAGIPPVPSDIDMPKMDGITLLRHLPGVAPGLRAIMVSASGDDRNIRSAIGPGACGFLTGPTGSERMRGAIDRALPEG